MRDFDGYRGVPEKRAATYCSDIGMALGGHEARGNCCVDLAVEEHDIIDEYRERLMPMKLRMVALLVTEEKVWAVWNGARLI